jgi:hypothetical protein
MAILSGSCPSCGAPIEFQVGTSVAKVCEFCKATVYRTDRGLEDLGKVAAIANVPSLIAVGDSGKLGGRSFTVLGRVQLDHGKGPWDEYYVSYADGSGWLAYAEGIWYATSESDRAIDVPDFESLRIEADVPLGEAGTFRVTEIKTARVASAEGEIPGGSLPGTARSYADLHGRNDGFATIDYGDRTRRHEVYLGRRFDERDLEIVEAGPRTAAKVKTDTIRCPNCGGDMPKLAGERAERIGCRYCGAVSDIAAQTVIARQEASMATPPIPIGARGRIGDVTWCSIAYLQRSADIEGERFAWEEMLLFAEGAGFRWLVKDETTWLFVDPVNIAELDLGGMPAVARYRGAGFRLRNRSTARVDYVLGEVYWKCEVGELVRTSDYVRGTEVLSREETPGEVRWSHSQAIPWPVLARAFDVSTGAAGGRFSTGGFGWEMNAGAILAIVIVVVVVLALASALRDFDSGGGAPVYGGSGWYYGGK